MKISQIILFTATSVSAFIFDLKDKPDTVNTYEAGKLTYTITYQYDSQGRVKMMSGDEEDGDITMTYSKSGDTTIMKIKYPGQTEEEIIKIGYDSNGKQLYTVDYFEGKLNEIKTCTYNSSGDLIKETYQLMYPEGLSSGDSATYAWDLTNHKIIARLYRHGTVDDMLEYEIDNDKRILKVYSYDCDGTCVKSGSYEEFKYSNSSVKMSLQHSVASMQRQGDNFFTIDGRMLPGNQVKVKGLIIDRQTSRIQVRLSNGRK